MSESFPLPTEPEGVIPSLIERFNSGKVEAMMALYARKPCSSRETGEPSLRFARGKVKRRNLWWQSLLDLDSVRHRCTCWSRHPLRLR